MNFILHKQKPTPRKIGVAGYPAGDKDNIAFFDSHHNLITELTKPELLHISSEGMMLRGFELNGFDKSGRHKYLYQEWWLRYDNTRDA